MKQHYLLVIISALAISVNAQTVTWGSGIACIVYTHCANCHNPNGIAPFSMITYSDVYAQRYNIVADINTGKMPPYSPDVNYQQYQHERYLTSSEVTILNNWVAAGAPAGDSTQAPAAPSFADGAVITNPDFTARIPDYVVPNTNGDLYRCFVISNPFPTAKYVSGVEVIPGDPAIVHHVLVYVDTSSVPVNLDNADPEPGYTNFGGVGSNTAKLINGWVPGSTVEFLPDSMGIKIPAGARIIIQVHYPTGSSGKLDSTRVNIRYNNLTGLRTVSVQPILNHVTDLVDGPLTIPANATATFHEQYTLPAGVSLLSVAPHAHLICHTMEAFAVKPGGDTINLVKIDNWSFHWQGSYGFKKLIYLPAGTVLHGVAGYDNTTNNPDNPSNPPVTVSMGESTTDEMMIFFFSYTVYRAGDETVIYDSTTSIPLFNNCTVTEVPTTGISSIESVKAWLFPNPTTGMLELTLESADEATAAFMDISGKVVRSETVKGGTNIINVADLAAGMYFIQITDRNNQFKPQTLKLAKQ